MDHATGRDRESERNRGRERKTETAGEAKRNENFIKGYERLDKKKEVGQNLNDEI